MLLHCHQALKKLFLFPQSQKEFKKAMEARLRKAILALKRQFPGRLDKSVLDDSITAITLIYKQQQDLYPNPHKSAVIQPDKLAVVLSDIRKAQWDFFTLLRTDESPDLLDRVETLEGYVKHGIDQCELLGDETLGYRLFNKAAQKAASRPAPPIRRKKVKEQ